MILMLAVLYALWDWARTPSTWRWLANETPEVAKTSDIPAGAKGKLPSAPSPSKPATASASPRDTNDVSPPSESAADSPTDEDPEERDAIAEEFQAVTDKTLEIQPEEMFAYRRILQWVANQPAAAMRKRARSDISFNNLMLSPGKYRGALVELVLNARLLRDCQITSGKNDLYEVWGFTTDSGAWLYSTVVLGLPDGFPKEPRIEERVRFVGYFLKLQGYHEGGAKPNAPPLAAPLLIGRLVWIQPPAPAASTSDATWIVVLLGGFSVIIALQVAWMFLRPKRRKPATATLGALKPNTQAIEQWFEHAESGGASPEEDG